MPRKRIRNIVVRGTVYNDMQSVADALGVHYTTVTKARREGWLDDLPNVRARKPYKKRDPLVTAAKALKKEPKKVQLVMPLKLPSKEESEIRLLNQKLDSIIVTTDLLQRQLAALVLRG